MSNLIWFFLDCSFVTSWSITEFSYNNNNNNNNNNNDDGDDDDDDNNNN